MTQKCERGVTTTRRKCINRNVECAKRTKDAGNVIPMRQEMHHSKNATNLNRRADIFLQALLEIEMKQGKE